MTYFGCCGDKPSWFLILAYLGTFMVPAIALALTVAVYGKAWWKWLRGKMFARLAVKE